MMVLRHGKVIAEGWWDPYKPELKHTMYSVSKSFTATAIGFAVAEKKLKVTDKVISFFPESLPKTISPNLAKLRNQGSAHNECRS
jgi:CubicO group peptidase (beta-lactamase class C family)